MNAIIAHLCRERARAEREVARLDRALKQPRHPGFYQRFSGRRGYEHEMARRKNVALKYLMDCTLALDAVRALPISPILPGGFVPTRGV